MKIVIPGGTGQLGTILARAFHSRGDDVTVLGRSPNSSPWRTLTWDARSLGGWMSAIDGADVVINLAGRSVNCRYTPANQRAIIDSRVASTTIVGQAIGQAPRPPRVWLQASTATIYAHTYGAPNDEATGQIGGAEPDAPAKWRFSISVAQAWEAALAAAETPHTRKVALRSSMVMSPDPGGIFDMLLGLVRKGLGGNAGSGRQYVSWIHHQDFVRALDWLIATDTVSGPVNVTAPSPLPYSDFMSGLRSAAGIRIGLPAMEWMLAVGALFMGTETELVLKSRRVAPGKLLEGGFRFSYPDWLPAAQELVTQWQVRRSDA